MIVSFVGCAATILTPEGGGRSLVKLLAASMIFFAFLSLFGNNSFSFSTDEYEDYESEARIAINEGKSKLENEILAKLREECEIKACEKAESLGLSVEVSFTVAIHSQKGYIAESVTVKYKKAPEEDAAEAFKRWLTEEMGISLGKQTYIFDF